MRALRSGEKVGVGSAGPPVLGPRLGPEPSHWFLWCQVLGKVSSRRAKQLATTPSYCEGRNQGKAEVGILPPAR